MGDHPLFNFCSRRRTADRDTTSAVDSLIMERDERPWGSYEVLTEAAGYKVKRIIVKPQQRLSLQMHEVRSEHWVVVAGEALATVGDREVKLGVDQTIDIPPRTRHRIANPGKVPLVFIEVQCGRYLGEDDITRFEDDYNRINESGDQAGPKP